MDHSKIFHIIFVNIYYICFIDNNSYDIGEEFKGYSTIFEEVGWESRWRRRRKGVKKDPEHYVLTDIFKIKYKLGSFPYIKLAVFYLYLEKSCN